MYIKDEDMKAIVEILDAYDKAVDHLLKSDVRDYYVWIPLRLARELSRKYRESGPVGDG